MLKARADYPVTPAAIPDSSGPADDLRRIAGFPGSEPIAPAAPKAPETSSGARIVSLPANVVQFARRQPITSALLPCRVGYFPQARGQKVSRPGGNRDFTLLLCLDGTGWLDLRDRRVALTGGSLVLLRPFEFHAYEADEEKPWSLYSIHFDGRMAAEYYDALTANGLRTHGPIELDVKLIQSFERILGIYRQGFAYHTLVEASAALHHFLGNVHAFIRAQPDAPEDIGTKIRRVIAIMRDDPGVKTSIREFAAALHMSRVYFTAKFFEHAGETPHVHFTRIKIQKACELLETTTTKIENVAQLVGYVDAFYFSRVFKRITGMSPSDFRKSRPLMAGAN